LNEQESVSLLLDSLAKQFLIFFYLTLKVFAADSFVVANSFDSVVEVIREWAVCEQSLRDRDRKEQNLAKGEERKLYSIFPSFWRYCRVEWV